MATAKKTTAKSAAKKTTAKKSAKKSTKKTPAKKSGAQHCWPGFEPVPGKEPGTKGSCKPKKTQTKSEKKGDQKAAAASKLGKK